MENVKIELELTKESLEFVCEYLGKHKTKYIKEIVEKLGIESDYKKVDRALFFLFDGLKDNLDKVKRGEQ